MTSKVRAKIEVELYFPDHWTDEEIKKALESYTITAIVSSASDYEITKRELLKGKRETA